METVNGNLKPYPIFLIGLANRHCIVVGGGKGAELKVKGLMESAATVTVIGPALTPQLENWAEEGGFTWLNRRYQPGDLQGAFLVIAEPSDAEQDALLFKEAEAEKALVNLIDDVAHSNFIAGAVMRQGALVISVSTSGASPALAVRLRERFQQEFGPEYGEFLELLMALRGPVSALIPEYHERRKRWYELVDADILELLRQGDQDQVYEQIAAVMGGEVLGLLVDEQGGQSNLQ